MILIPANMTLVPGAGMYRIVYHIYIRRGDGSVLFPADDSDGGNDRDCDVYCQYHMEFGNGIDKEKKGIQE